MNSLDVAEEQRQEITKEKILELVAKRGYTSTELIKRTLENFFFKNHNNILNRLYKNQANVYYLIHHKVIFYLQLLHL